MVARKHFALESSIPNATSIFSNDYRRLSDITDHCLVGLDTSILLAPYKLEADSLEAIRSVYAKLVLQNRLIVPGRVVREYAKRRSAELANLVKTLRDQSSRVFNPFEKQINFLIGDSDYISLIALGLKIGEISGEMTKLVSSVVERLEDWVSGDPVLQMYKEVLVGTVRDFDIADEAATDFEQELAFRYEHSIPPGYKDKDKADGGSGDLIIWKTILKIAESEKGKDFLFVTGDEKNDWWIRTERVFQPRYELMDEFWRASDGGTLHITHLPGLLRLFKAAPAVITATEKAAEEERAQTDITAEFDVDEGDLDPLETRRAMLMQRLRNLDSSLDYLKRQFQASELHTRDSRISRRDVGQRIRTLTGSIEAIRRELQDIEEQTSVRTSEDN